MDLICGLGNPGAQYAATRHNVGFRVLEQFAEEYRGTAWQAGGEAATARVSMAGTDLVLLKPLTYMNRSGEALGWVLERMEPEPTLERVLIVTDDVALPLGRMRLRKSGSCGGHNGLASIEATLATREYPRLRIGVGPAGGHTVEGEVLVDYVLGAFTDAEEAVLKTVIPAAAEALAQWVTDGLEACQQAVNGRWFGPGEPPGGSNEEPAPPRREDGTPTEE